MDMGKNKRDYLDQNLIDNQDYNSYGQSDTQNNYETQEAEFKKFDMTLLLVLILGIVLIYLSMIPLNALIFSQISQVKTGFYISIVSSNALFAVLILLLKKFKKISWHELGWNSMRLSKAIIQALKIWGITWIFYIAYLLFLSGIGITPPENELSRLLESPTIFFLLLNVFLIAVIAPIIEETLFRGMLLGGLKTYMGPWTAIIISAALFSALHLDLIGFFTRFVLGIGLGYLYLKYESLLPSVLLHAFNNLLAVLAVAVFS